MSVKDFTANVISKTPIVPDGNFKNSKASGVWDINEALDLIKGGNWPNAANVNPSAFVDGLFQTHLWSGTGSDQTITNNIDLSGEGGLVWLKNRTNANNHWLLDSARNSFQDRLQSSTTNAKSTNTGAYIAPSSTGFVTKGNDGNINESGYDYVSWTFRKQPKFFDVVTYTGNGTRGRTVSHNLGSTPGMIIIKQTSGSEAWAVYHRSIGATKHLRLNTEDGKFDDLTVFADTEPTSSVFSVGEDAKVNSNNSTYVAYVFAHNDDDGGFGEPGNQDIIKCDTYTGNGNATGPVINLGFEPQFLMIKNSSAEASWTILDTMRGFDWNVNYDPFLRPNLSNVEAAAFDCANPLATGFQLKATSVMFNTNSDTFIYMAIRRGGMQTPTAASDVFHVVDSGASNAAVANTGFPVDMAINTQTNSENHRYVITRLLDKTYLRTNLANAEAAAANTDWFDSNTSLDTVTNWWAGNAQVVNFSWARARGYFDVVAYTGDGASSRSVSHNLSVVPEMMWVKSRSEAKGWIVYHKDLGATKYLLIQETDAAATQTIYWNDTDPTSSVFNLGNTHRVNDSGGETYVAYLFATVANVSKVGSFTQSGATNVACGFTGDTPSFILLKRTDDTGDWLTFDSARGIVAGNDPYIELNDLTVEVTNADIVDPYSGGFATTSSLTDGDYIFYAIASTA